MKPRELFGAIDEFGDWVVSEDILDAKDKFARTTIYYFREVMPDETPEYGSPYEIMCSTLGADRDKWKSLAADLAVALEGARDYVCQDYCHSGKHFHEKLDDVLARSKAELEVDK